MKHSFIFGYPVFGGSGNGGEYTPPEPPQWNIEVNDNGVFVRSYERPGRRPRVVSVADGVAELG